jgi:hypothetical protein
MSFAKAKCKSSFTDSCCKHDEGQQEPSENRVPCKHCVQCASVLAYLPSEKSSIDGPSGFVALHIATVPLVGTDLDSINSQTLTLDERPIPGLPLNVLHQVFLI